MTLARLIRKSEVLTVATAISAISATDGHEGGAIVARIATVAVASPTDEETADAATSRHWRIQFPDRDPLEVFFNPDADLHEVMRQYPTATDLEPIPEPPRAILSPSGLWYFTPPAPLSPQHPATGHFGNRGKAHNPTPQKEIDND